MSGAVDRRAFVAALVAGVPDGLGLALARPDRPVGSPATASS
ncbi:hypothetical protein ACIBI9_19745 [Nonomuraea sp. NPDC050451]